VLGKDQGNHRCTEAQRVFYYCFPASCSSVSDRGGGVLVFSHTKARRARRFFEGRCLRLNTCLFVAPSALCAEGGSWGHSPSSAAVWDRGAPGGASVCLPADEQTLVPPRRRSRRHPVKKSLRLCVSALTLNSQRLAGGDARSRLRIHKPRTKLACPLSLTDHELSAFFASRVWGIRVTLHTERTRFAMDG
jgi:hypothetical protein